MGTIRKYSRKREAILECLRRTKTHPSAEWVYTQLKAEYPDLSLATVYRNLALFKQEGAITSVGTVNGLERFDYNTCPHAHFVCESCDAVLDIAEIELPGALYEQAAAQLGAEIRGGSICFTGRCSRCRKETIESNHSAQAG